MKQSERKRMSLKTLKSNELPVVWNLVSFTSNLPVSIYSDTTVVKTSETCYRGAMVSENARLASEEYLLNAKKSSIDIALPIGTFSYSTLPPRLAISFKNFVDEDLYNFGVLNKLPNPRKVNAPIGSVILSRRSHREFGDSYMTLLDLSTVLNYGDGVSGKFNHNPSGFFPTSYSLGNKYESNVRCAPSGGGLYPVDLFLVCLRVKDLKTGIYRYRPDEHALQTIRELDEADIEEYMQLNGFGPNIDQKRMCCCIYYVYRLYDNSRKYDDMAFQFALIEAGEIAENIHLIATAENIASCDIGGFEKRKTEMFLGVDGLTTHIVHTTILGMK